jgi:hypothetical protein
MSSKKSWFMAIFAKNVDDVCRFYYRFFSWVQITAKKLKINFNYISNKEEPLLRRIVLYNKRARNDRANIYKRSQLVNTNI